MLLSTASENRLLKLSRKFKTFSNFSRSSLYSSLYSTLLWNSAAIVKITGIMSDEDFLRDMEGSFKHKFATKPEVIEGNMKAIERALKEINKLR